MHSDDLIVIGMLVAGFVLAGTVTFALTGRDLKGSARAGVSLLSALLVGLTSLFVPWLPLLAFLATAAAYLVMRRMIKPGLALAASAVVLFGGLSGAAALMAAAMHSM